MEANSENEANEWVAILQWKLVRDWCCCCCHIAFYYYFIETHERH